MISDQFLIWMNYKKYIGKKGEFEYRLEMKLHQGIFVSMCNNGRIIEVWIYRECSSFLEMTIMEIADKMA